jgi:hypothetical protein
MNRRVDLRENGESVALLLAPDAGAALAATGFVDARPLPGTSAWSIH